MMHTLVAQMGPAAHACLSPGQRGKVLAAFSTAIYLQTEDSELFWIISDTAPMHRRALKISSPLPGPQAGSPFLVTDHRLTIDPGFVYELEHARLWRVPQISREDTLEITEIPAGVQTFIARLDLDQVQGFGNFIPDIRRLSKNESSEPKSESAAPILVFARPYVLEMARACLENQPSRILQNIHTLIGLGAGLTPSGDDFLGGLLFCIKTLQTTYPAANFFDRAISVEPYRARTHPISFALLQDLANGQAIAPVHHIINGILSGKSFEIIHQPIRQLTRVGHSTGWDLLAGLLTGLLTLQPGHLLNSAYQTVQSVHSVQA